MAVLTRDDFFERLQKTIGTDTSEDSISLLEDMTDTYNDLEQRANGDGIDWQQRYNDLDKSWREKYRHRFFSGGNSAIPSPMSNDEPDEREKATNITFNDLFK